MQRGINILSAFILISLLDATMITNLFAQSNIKIGELAPEIHIDKWLLNKPKDITTKSKFIILDFWATWCPPCLRNVGHMNALQEKYKDEMVLFLQMTNESEKTARSVFDIVDFKAPVVIDQNNLTSANFGDGLNDLAYYPFVVLIDDNNIVRWFGSPDKLNSAMMDNFFQRKNLEVPQMSFNGPHDIAQDPETYINREYGLKLWSDLMHNPNIIFTSYIEEVPVDQENMIDAITSTGAIIPHESLKNILKQLYPKTQFEIPQSIKNKKYNFYFVDHDLNAESKEILINSIANQLNLTYNIGRVKGYEYELYIFDPDLLVSASKKIEGPIKFESETLNMRRNSISDLASALSLRSNSYFYTNTKSNKSYEFSIDLSTYESIIESLKCSGIKLIKKKRKFDSYVFETKI